MAGVLNNKTVLSVVFMLPVASILLLFLTYPLGLGIWMGFTDARIGRPGIFIGLENYFSLFDDDVFWLSVFNTPFSTFKPVERPRSLATALRSASLRTAPGFSAWYSRHRLAFREAGKCLVHQQAGYSIVMAEGCGMSEDVTSVFNQPKRPRRHGCCADWMVWQGGSQNRRLLDLLTRQALEL
jgi:hypothetical protein